MKTLMDPAQFVWDQGNSAKNEQKHGVSDQEAEEPFFDKKRKVFTDLLHSGKKERFRIVGMTNKHRLLFVAFTIRNSCIRIISARDINKKEVFLYEKIT